MLPLHASPVFGVDFSYSQAPLVGRTPGGSTLSGASLRRSLSLGRRLSNYAYTLAPRRPCAKKSRIIKPIMLFARYSFMDFFMFIVSNLTLLQRADLVYGHVLD